MNNAEQHRQTAIALGQSLGKKARETGVKNREISVSTGIPETTLSRIFNGRVCARLEYLVAIANELGFSLVLCSPMPTFKSNWLPKCAERNT